MEIVKQNKDEDKTVVKHYRGCGHLEYYGAIHMRNGLNFCRKCIYNQWERESQWKRQKEDYEFPLYMDGVNYYNEEK